MDDAGVLEDLHKFQAAGLSQLTSAAVSPSQQLRRRAPTARAQAFRFMQPPHTGSVTVVAAISLAAGCHGYDTPCEILGFRSARNMHDHNRLPQDRFPPRQWAEFEQQYTFAFVRDPWSRMVSCAGWNEAIDSAKSTQNLTFDETIRGFREFVRRNIANGRRGKCSYLFDVSDWTHATPPNATERRQVVDFVGRTSRLAKDFEHVTDALGLPRVDLNSIPGHCVSSCPNGEGTRSMVQWSSRAQRYHVPRVVDFYDDETRGLVAEAWKEDIKIFGFEFGKD